MGKVFVNPAAWFFFACKKTHPSRDDFRQALPVSKPFDCGAALQNWVARWSEKKKAPWDRKNPKNRCGNWKGFER